MASSPANRFAEIGSDKPSVGPRAGLGTAIVLGGSVAGMLAARVLADHAETVVWRAWRVRNDPLPAPTPPLG